MNPLTRWFGRFSRDLPAPPPVPNLPPAEHLVRAPETHGDTGSQFTLVRHSQYSVSADPAFEGAVEVRELTRNQAYVVRKAGGVVFPTSEAAGHAEAVANQPNVAGYFSSVRIGGAEVYMPPVAVRVKSVA